MIDKNNILNILGVNISILKKQEVLKKIEQFLNNGKQHHVITPNPEFILEARKDEEFFYILNNADLAIPDGVGLKFAGWAMVKNLHRITGADLIKDILKIAKHKNLKVAILNWSGGLSSRKDIIRALQEKYPVLKFVIKDIGRDKKVKEFGSGYPELSSVNEFQPDVLFCTLGAPWQEKFIYHNIKKIPSVKISIGVGGAFDYLTGSIKRAPKFIRVIGLEWLWRLFKQPWRWKRIYNAVLVFPIKFLQWKFFLPFFYRPNVICILYKKDIRRAAIPSTRDVHTNENKCNYKILLVERLVEKNHWQLPQGGTDGESIKKAGERELIEELGTNKFDIIKTYNNLWKYKFGTEISKFKVNSKLIWGHKGQKQNLAIAKFLGKDEDIKINFWDHSGWKWVDADNLVNEVHPVRREAAKIFLDKFNQVIKKYEDKT